MTRPPASSPLRIALWTGAWCACVLAAQAAGPLRSEAELRAFYGRACAGCHGEDGSGTAADGRRLRGRDFTATQDMGRFTDAALARSIRKGLFFGLSMPAFKEDLTEAESLILVRDILRRARKGIPIQTPRQAPPPAR